MYGRSPPPRHRILRPTEEGVLSSILPHVTYCDAWRALIQHREIGDEQVERFDKGITPSPDSLIGHFVKERRAYVHVREAARVHKKDEEMNDQGDRDPRHFGRGVPLLSAERCPRPPRC